MGRHVNMLRAVLCVTLIAGVTFTQSFASPQPVAFTKNLGQWPDSILFRADAGGAVMWIVKDGIHYQFIKSIPKNLTGEEALAAGLGPRGERQFEKFDRMTKDDSIIVDMVKAQFVDANPDVEVVGLEELEYKCNYFIGNEPAKWRSDVPNFAGIIMRNLYPGVDATLSTKLGRLSCELSGSPAAIAAVQTSYDGGSIQPIDAPVEVATALGAKRFQGLLPAGDEVTARTPSVNAQSTGSLVYSTYLSGDVTDEGFGIKVDAAGSAYVAGVTLSTDFPTQSQFQSDPGDALWDVFVTKLTPSGSGLVYSTYVGGSHDDRGYDLALDAAGSAYVTGYTSSTDFPTLSPYQTDQGSSDVLVFKLSPSGSSLLFSTYLGGTTADQGGGIAIDGAGSVYVTGFTNSTDFPTLLPFQTDPGDNHYDVFVTKLSASGTTLVYSTYLGGTNADFGEAIAVDSAGSAYVTGYTASFNYPTAVPYQTDVGFNDGFVTKLSTSGSSLIYSTYLGGNNQDYGFGIALDGEGCAYVAGHTFSTNFPTMSPYQINQAAEDAFVTKLSSSGTSLVYSTYLGASDNELAEAIAVDEAGCAYVTGSTLSANFPTLSPYQPNQLGEDVFVTKFSASGSSLVYSTYLGGTGIENGFGIAVNASGSACVTGRTYSTNFPTLSPYQTDQASSDAFVTRFVGNPAGCCVLATGNIDCDPADAADISDVTVLIDHLFINFTPLCCPSEGNTDGDALCGVDISDLTVLIDHIFISLAPTAACTCP